jgi:hypothetical protein
MEGRGCSEKKEKKRECARIETRIRLFMERKDDETR